MTDYQNIYTASHLLAIGINQYADPRFVPLGNAEADASEIGEVLSSSPYQFNTEILIGEQATKQAILDALFRLRRSRLDDRVVVYFAGHGYTLANRRGHETGYLACSDSIPDRDYTALQLDEVTDLRDHTDAKHICFIFDACFSGQALGLTRGIASEGFLDRRAYQVLSAGAGDQTVADYLSMTRLLLENLREPQEMLTLSNMGIAVQTRMRANSKGRQIPQFGHLTESQGGDLVFYVPPVAHFVDLLPNDLHADLTDENPRLRLRAIAEAEQLLKDPEVGDAVRQVLEAMQYDDDDRVVRHRAREALLTIDPTREEPPLTVPVVMNLDSMPSLASTDVGIALKPKSTLQNGPHKPFEPEMVLIPSGPFIMGTHTSLEWRGHDPEPFEMQLDYDYFIGKYPVTVGQYRAFIDAGAYQNSAYWTQTGLAWLGTRQQPEHWSDEKYTGHPDLPVMGVSWYEAYAYTKWLVESTGREYRLLKEAEWEKAARGGLMIPDGNGGMKQNPNATRIWPWGDEEPTKDLCNFNHNTGHGWQGVGRTTVVTSHEMQAQKQPYGLYHMAGNVKEWCLSKWSNTYLVDEDCDPEGDAMRSSRGGGWGSHHSSMCRVSHRYSEFPYICAWGGFRVGASSL